MAAKKQFRNIALSSILAGFIFVPGLTGKWSATVDGGGANIIIYYNFKTDGQTLTGTVEGPDGIVDINNGTFKDSVLSFDMLNGPTSLLHNTGKYYGDSVTLDLTVRKGPIHLKLTRVK